jgi:hypothetical protein
MLALEWLRLCYQEAAEMLSVRHIRQQLTRRKQAREWRKL